MNNVPSHEQLAADRLRKFTKRIDRFAGRAHDYFWLDAKSPNIRAAVDWCDANGEHEMAARLFVALEDFGMARAGWGPLTERAKLILTKPGIEPAIRGLLHVTLARIAFRRGDYGELESRIDAAEAEGRTDVLVRARVAFMRAALCRKQGEYARSRDYCMISLDALRDAHPFDKAVARYNIGAAYDEDPAGDPDLAIVQFQKCERTFLALRAHHRAARCALRRLSLELRLQRHEDPESAMRELTDRFADYPRELVLLKLLDADHHERQGDLRTAEELFDAAAVEARTHGAAPELERARNALARLRERRQES